ncbi:hypothetical protein HD596_000313 [Nonomuraea jabiensis]|uniref:Uncharacterized protein n=1 Tax=Nonomuraea jabiensis TaxID=882448 RepID=A0A7W9FXV3_9ACTN|nr:hypothetical protein [Nonomuraea jabiensis]
MCGSNIRPQLPPCRRRRFQTAGPACGRHMRFFPSRLPARAAHGLGKASRNLTERGVVWGRWKPCSSSRRSRFMRRSRRDDPCAEVRGAMAQTRKVTINLDADLFADAQAIQAHMGHDNMSASPRLSGPCQD